MARKLVSPTGKAKTLKPIRPNLGIEIDYRKKLDTLITEMEKSVIYWLTAQYRKTPPVMAHDKSPAKSLDEAFARVASRWQRRFNQLAPALAAYFATSAAQRSDASLRAALKRAGFTVKFTMSRAQNDALQATIAENIGLIKSIPAQYLTQVQGIAMRSITAGRDLFTMRKELQAQFGVTKRRASLIARDQNNKATATFNQVRFIELGITKAVWRHSTAGKHPRPSHVKADGRPYDVAVGLYLDGVWTIPGREINCRCFSTPIIPGLEDK